MLDRRATHNVCPRIRPLVVLVALLVGAALYSFGEPVAQASRDGTHNRSCAPETIQTALGATRVHFVLHGRVTCATAHHVVRAYFRGAPTEVQGSGGFLTLAGGWTCHSEPGAVTARTGHMGACVHGSATINTYEHAPQGLAALMSCPNPNVPFPIHNLEVENITCGAADTAIVHGRYTPGGYTAPGYVCSLSDPDEDSATYRCTSGRCLLPILEWRLDSGARLILRPPSVRSTHARHRRCSG